MKCSENLTLLQFEFQIWLPSFEWKIKNKNILRKRKHSTIESSTLP
jgi:hypothetical protein